MAIRRSSVGRDILIGMGAGLLRSLAVGSANAFLSRFVSEEQVRTELAVREDSPQS